MFMFVIMRMCGRGYFDVFIVGNLFILKCNVPFEVIHQLSVVQLVIDPLHLFFVLHKGVNDGIIAFLHLRIHISHVHLSQHVGTDIIPDVFILHFDIILLDQFVLNQLPFHRIGKGSIVFFNLLRRVFTVVMLNQPAFQEFIR